MSMVMYFAFELSTLSAYPYANIATSSDTNSNPPGAAKYPPAEFVDVGSLLEPV